MVIFDKALLPYTWTNGKDNPMMGSLDRSLVSGDWEDVYPNYYQEVLPKLTLDRWSILLNTMAQNFRPKPFRFENIWVTSLFQRFGAFLVK